MFGWVFDSLSRRAAIWVQEWNENSVERKRLSYPTHERVLRWSAEHSIRFLFLVWAVVILLTVVFGWVMPECFGFFLVTSTWEDAENLAYFGTLWTIQATIAALVYPIVIAFVAVLLQRRATAKLSFRLYVLDAAVVPAGSGAIALLTWMGLQYTFISFAPITWLAAAMVGNSTWFVLNSLMTGWFLYRTVLFLDDEARLEVFKRFGVQVAFLREVRGHLLGLIFSNAKAQKLIPGGEYTSEDPGPKVLLFPISEGEPCITVDLNKEQQIADIRLRLLRWGVSLWLRQAKHAAVPPAIAGLRPQYPLLGIPLALGQVVNGKIVLCRIRYGPQPGIVAAFLIRHSIVFGPPPNPIVSYSTSEIMEELSMEALELAERKRFEAASEAVLGLVDLHAALIRAGAFVHDDGEPDNAALLPDPYGFASRPIHERWLEAYRSLAEMAVRNLVVDSTLYRRHCYLAYRLLYSARGQHPDILTYSCHISTYLMYRLGIWWSEQIEERGLIEHDVLHGVVLPPPISGTYDRALREFVGGWEQIEFFKPKDDSSNADDAWEAHCHQARFASAQAEQTVHMLLSAVYRGDRAAALWLADSFLKWWNKFEHHFDGYGAYENGNHLLTVTCMWEKWSVVRGLLDAVPEGTQELVTTTEVAATVLRRYWTDLRLVVVCILLDWSSADAPSDAFALELAVALLQGRNLKHDGRVDTDALTNSPFVLFRLVRLQLANHKYSQMLDRVVERAEELRKPDMVSGRVYSSSGSDDVGSLCVAQTQVLTAITAASLRPLPELTAAVRSWSLDLQQLQQLKHMTQGLVDCMSSNAFLDKLPITCAIRLVIGLPDNAEEAREWVSATLKGIAGLAQETHNETLSKADVSKASLDKLGKFVSDYVLGAENEVFPFTLKPKIQPVSNAGTPRSLTISGVSKMPYTEPPLSIESSSLRSSYSEHVAESIGRNLISDYLVAMNESTPIS